MKEKEAKQPMLVKQRTKSRNDDDDHNDNKTVAI